MLCKTKLAHLLKLKHMLDIKFIRENPEKVKKAVEDKQLAGTVDVDKLLELEQQHRNLLQEVEDIRAERNKLTKQIAEATPADKETLLKKAGEIKTALSEKEGSLTQIKTKLDEELLKVPNIIHESVPIGKDESENVVLRKWGGPTEFDFEPKDHVELGTKLDLIDIETSAEVSGARFNYLKNEAVLLQFAVIQFTFDTLLDDQIIGKLAEKVESPSAKPFTPILPPAILKAEIAKKMDRFDPIEDRYYFEEDDVLLAGSAEHTLGPIHMDQTLQAKDLPIRYVGYSTAFRREAGSYGKDTKGIIRRHQFDKLEMESFTTPEIGLAEQDLMVAIQEYMVQKLEIPYQVVVLCTGDMGKPDYRQIDIECWMPGEGKYRETHTSDYMTDYQAQRLEIRYRDGAKSGFVHMNDATAFAIGRTLIAILENYQQADGSVVIPKVLQKYMGIKTIPAH